MEAGTLCSHFQTKNPDQTELMIGLALLDHPLGSKIWLQLSWLLFQAQGDLDFQKYLCDLLSQNQTWEHHPIF